MAVAFPLGDLKVRFSGDTHVGRKRGHNEDNFHLPGPDRLALVADGMGGHASGEVASRLAVDTVVDYFRSTAAEPEVTWPFKIDHGLRHSTNRLVIGIKLANAKIWEAAQVNPAQHGMGTTLVATLFLEGRVVIAHVGDSRVYRLREGSLAQLTDDHSLLNDYMKLKHLRADEVSNFPQKNVIVRALGMKESVQVDLFVDQPRAGDLYLLCSDGLSGMVADEELSEILLREGDLDAAVQKLIESANEHGGTDNITVLLASVESTRSAVRPDPATAS
jgi:protein phosphatase